MRILYIEDNPIFHVQMKGLADFSHWDLTTAKTGQEGVALAHDHEYDIVLMDIDLGAESHFNGYEAAQRIKAIKPNLIIVSFSSSSLAGRAQLGPEMDGHFEKTISQPHLEEILKTKLRGAH